VKTLLEKIASVSNGPGVYLMKDNSDAVLYVGKASNLKKRLASYFSKKSHPDLKTGILVKKIISFDTILTASEKEALILESTLIKHHRPRYNVILKDDKRYPSIRIDIQNEFPCLQIVRKIKNDGSLYFGPYASAGSVRHTVNLINKTFKLRKCVSSKVKQRSRPCLNCQMGLCLAPCCYPVNKKLYANIVNEVRMVLNGRTHELIKKLRNSMVVSAKKQDYEVAAKIRDKVFALEKTVEKQIVVITDFIDRDVIGIAKNEMMTLVVMLFVRKGHLQSVRHFVFHDTLSNDHEIADAFIKQYYENCDYIPKEILTPICLRDAEVYSDWFSHLKNAKVKIANPKRGNKLRLLNMAAENAQVRLKKVIEEASSTAECLSRLEKKLRLPALPHRIECYDNSGMSGTNMVAGMVVYIHGKPEKSYYRRYTIKSVDIQDDYACMKEVLERRFKKKNQTGDLPDLLIVDGGKGQLNIALSVLKQLKLENSFSIIGIAKKEVVKNEIHDKVYLPARANPVNFGKDMDTYMFLQRIRDEAHRYAVSFHRQKRGNAALRSVLDDIPGIGKKRKTALLKQFKSLQKIREASIEDLSVVSGMTAKVAKSVHLYLNDFQ